MLEERTKIPVVGVAPYLNVDIEDEDSLAERVKGNREVDLIDIAVIAFRGFQTLRILMHLK